MSDSAALLRFFFTAILSVAIPTVILMLFNPTTKGNKRDR